MLEVSRTENKILLNQKEFMILKYKISQILPRDKFCKSDEGYEIRSLYFDTLSDRCCQEKEDGLRRHEKIRVRIYGTDDTVIKLESKKKDGIHQIKKSLLISRETLDNICHGKYSDLLNYEDKMGIYFYEKLSEGMRPKNIIQYKRLSYCIKTNNTRITFDYNIRATESCFDIFQDPLQAHPITSGDVVIMEVKFNGFLLDYIKDTLRCVEAMPTSFSKYFMGRTFYRYMI